ncbi:HAMP domain-containing protein [Desulfopila sp. IMCC35006]|uniref:CHASE4 domain-containing protein n=1 Tax=Desulfopila sp. IMCC35006 TaxID=2569542 RepID=UPI0010AC804B|nr:CHASE4 domain-containing protein [Desulfopila sp. IMCC35006]TKB23491.1 HAMP domain-containing protein [Desulfopila sp. IMCC35006]
MSLKNKAITLLFCIFGAYAIVEYTVQRFVLMPAFVQLQQAEATNNTERALQALEREVAILIPSATDWATWDDTYRFMVDQNVEYVESNLNLQALESLNVNLIAFYTPEGMRLWGIGYDYENKKEMVLNELAEDHLDLANPLLDSSEKLGSVAGLYHTPAGIILIASRPVLTSKGDGPSRGRVVIGRLLDMATIERLGSQARVSLRAEFLSPVKNQPVLQSKDSGTIRYTPINLSKSDTITRGSTEVLDVTGIPILRVHVDTPRVIVAQGRTTLRYASLSLAVAGTIVLLVLLLFLRRTVFDPITLLTRHAITVGTDDDLSTRLQMKRRDEIGTLAKEFDIMVERLAETRLRLLDQSYKSGIAEMASGALHNIGNAITPIGVKLINLRRVLKQAPVLELAMAGAELADPATPADRKADLAQFSELAGNELAAMVTSAADELETIRSQVDVVQMILADQQRFSRAERVMESLELSRLIGETVRLLPEELHKSVRIEIDDGLTEIGRVRVARIALQQILTNLFINGAESISASARQKQDGWIRVYPVVVDMDPQGLVHICFEDNGIGISSEQLPHLFERGFSTKNRGSGIGLHWCANTLAAMGGRIYAGSAGTGQGACMHLLLPLAEYVQSNLEKAA